MIVNGGGTVDKPDFFHNLKGLRVSEAVEQGLFLDGIEIGQKIGGCASRQFRTFDPVDIHQLIHKHGQIEAATRRFFRTGWSSVGWTGSPSTR